MILNIHRRQAKLFLKKDVVYSGKKKQYNLNYNKKSFFCILSGLYLISTMEELVTMWHGSVSTI